MLDGLDKVKRAKGGSFMKAAVISAKLNSKEVKGSTLNIMNLRAKNSDVKYKFTAANAQKDFIEFERKC
jgi:hypothetical protein